MIRNVIISTLILTCFNGYAQDVHFSQFDRNPLFLNPALTGQMDGWMRSSLQHRSQWTVLGASYKTTSFSFDTPLMKGRRGAYMGLGLNVLRDEAGDSKFGFTNVGLNTSAILPIGAQSELSLGIRVAFVQRTMSAANLQWDSQFDGLGFNGGLPGEGLAGQSFAYLDYNTGLNLHIETENSTISSNDGLVLDIGGSYNHLTQPAIHFNGGDILPARIMVYGIGLVGIYSTRYFVRPQVLYAMQRRQKEIVFGGLFGYKLMEDSRTTGFVRRSSISMGLLYRLQDALIPTFNYEIADFTLQVSYDINSSRLTPYTSGRGGLEISLSYVDHLGSLFGKRGGRPSL